MEKMYKKSQRVNAKCFVEKIMRLFDHDDLGNIEETSNNLIFPIGVGQMNFHLLVRMLYH